jgi:hypothetical protein
MEATQAHLAPLPEAEHNPNGGEPDEVEVARGEVVDDNKQIDWHGLGLTLPASLPAAMMFDMTEAEIEGDDATGGSAAVHTVYKLLGKDQWRQAKRHADELNLSVEDFSDFINQVYAAYGMGPGESSESSSSQGKGGDS